MVAPSFSVSDLVLDVPEKLDPKRFDLDAYMGFIELLCGGRVFQEAALAATLRFLLGGEFANVGDLAKHSYQKNQILEACYGSLDSLLASLRLRDRLACSVDLATGTGKSYVIFGLARILLNEGAVDRVLVLCPSTTIESGLLDKFRVLSADRDLRDSLPKRSGIRNPDIIQATSTIEPGKICVENIHATYAGTRSAIVDSLRGKGGSTLVLNDEAHHIYTPGTDRALKKWQGFLEDEEFGFERIVGFSGTCYIGNDYFPDVVYRYSIAQAMEDGRVKKIWYVDEDVTKTENEAFQKIRANHENNRQQYRPLKPLTILVTKDIKAAREIGRRLSTFLDSAVTRKRSGDDVLVVTSDKEHQANVARLPTVDSKNSPIEWIVSVSMLSEGWDVKNVFQIVPHEQRAFNSKLLIAQVLGRGLRIPGGLAAGQQPDVVVFNHESWAPAIRHLADEVMENEVRLASYPIDERGGYNFEIHQVVYEQAERSETISPSNGKTDILKKGRIALLPQASKIKRRTRYEKADTKETREEAVHVSYPLRPVPDVAARVRNHLKSIDIEEGTTYAKDIPQQRLETVIRRSLKEAGSSDDMVSEENEQRILAAFGPLTRRRSKQVRLTVEVDHLDRVSTKDLPSRSLGLGALRKEAGIFYDDVSLDAGHESDRKILKELDESHSYGSAVQRVPNPYNFKSPVNIVAVTHSPEKRFVRELLRSENAKVIDGWIKSPDSQFYEIDYSWRKGEHQKQASFNPDFFISIKGGKEVLVVETKIDTDLSDENRGKLKYAEQHFAVVNRKQKATTYVFYFLSPKDYDTFFQAVRDDSYPKFRSALQTRLAQ